MAKEMLRVAISGSTGLVGSHLRDSLLAEGHKVSRMVRGQAASDPEDIAWEPQTGELRGDLDGLDAVVHLAGENIGTKRWNPERKQLLRDSRVSPTERLCQRLAALRRPPRVLLSASAIGYYGDRGAELLDESSAPGEGFLAELCRHWEEATETAQQAGIRVVNVRIGVALSASGGALKTMLTPFRLGLGGVVGSGRQFMSWIALDDLVAALRFCLFTDALSGPVNAVSPSPVTNADFTKTLARVLHRPALIPIPAAAVRLAFGEMGEELLLHGARVMPSKLQAADFPFAYPSLAAALRSALGSAS